MPCLVLKGPLKGADCHLHLCILTLFPAHSRYSIQFCWKIIRSSEQFPNKYVFKLFYYYFLRKQLHFGEYLWQTYQFPIQQSNRRSKLLKGGIWASDVSLSRSITYSSPRNVCAEAFEPQLCIPSFAPSFALRLAIGLWYCGWCENPEMQSEPNHVSQDHVTMGE